ncbi:hypothetical protein F5876DRAFT_65539 [Lentinula aff. lateritia]|uniref:Uncharacterized protein n=1 Tax=Lentinula aff. lateritia TaxID=2804960 RepID=A0ACC1U0F6_9AGAR|nr:hypothetical protein F5876DRAFT_65539 [Lentinula aff. lateritia]
MTTYTARPDNLDWKKRAHVSNFRQSNSSITSSRQELLYELLSGIQADEDSARLLLQTFDIDEDWDFEDEDAFTPQTPLRPVKDLNPPHETNAPQDSAAFNLPLRPSHSENPFLSTPLRVKYFPNLSPSILRQLLRSPSPNFYSSDESFEAISASPLSLSVPSSLELQNIRNTSCANPQAGQSSSLIYPLTPPLTARIPCTNSHETPVRMLRSPLYLDVVSTPGLHIEGVDLDSVPDIRACLSSMTPFTAIESHQSRRKRQPFMNSAADFSALSTTTPNSQCVSKGIRADGETASGVKAVPLAETIASFGPPSTPASPLLQTSSTARIYQNRRTLKPGRVLQREFVELLEARAMEEEKMAQVLNMMTKRLERLVLQRRRLVALLIEETRY